MPKNYKMSLSVAPVPVLTTDDPRIDLNVEPFYLVERGAGEVIYRDYAADSFSGGTININTQISDRRTVVDSKVLLKTKFTVVATASAAIFSAGAPATAPGIGGRIAQGRIAPRYSPLMSSCTNAVLNLNGKQFSQPIARYNTPLMKYCTSNDEAAYDFSTFPSYQDVLSEFYSYAETPAYAGGVPQPTNDQFLSAMGSNADCDPYSASKRMGWLQNVAIQSEDATTTVLTFTFETEEILPLSPLIWGHKQVKGLSGLDTLSIYLNYDSGLLNKALQYSPIGTAANTFTSIAFNVSISACSAEFIYFSPRANMEIPPVLRYRYNNIQYVSKNIPTGSLTGANFYNQYSKVGPTFTDFTSDSITLQGLPKRMYVFVKRQQQLINSATPDTYARITKINLMLGNKPGILAEATPQALYRMSVKNGYQGSWDNWYNNCGSVICIDFAQDIPLGLLDAPGTLSKMNLQFSVSGTSLYYDYDPANAAGAYYTPLLELNTVLVYDGIVVIKDGQVIQEQNDVSPLDVVNGTKVNHVYYHDIIDYAGGNYAGGAISKYIDAVKRGFGKVKDLANKAAPYIEKYGPKVLSAAEKALPIVASVLAAGYTENEIYAIMDSYAKSEKKKPVKGGARAGKASLKARAIKM
jgi:hypothetical protein